MKRDFKKERKDLYSPKTGIFEVTIPSMKLIAVDGNGPLNGEHPEDDGDPFQSGIRDQDEQNVRSPA